MPVFEARIVARPKPFKVLHGATVVFEAENIEAAEEQANSYADRLGAYDSAYVDSLHEIGGVKAP